MLFTVFIVLVFTVFTIDTPGAHSSYKLAIEAAILFSFNFDFYYSPNIFLCNAFHRLITINFTIYYKKIMSIILKEMDRFYMLDFYIQVDNGWNFVLLCGILF